jgi:hypothetical protein
MNCKHCANAFEPKQQYCCDACRIAAFRNKGNDAVTITTTETITLHNETIPLQREENVTHRNYKPLTSCKKHHGSFTCGC